MPDDLHLDLRTSMAIPEPRSLVVDSPCPPSPAPRRAIRTCEKEPIALDGDEGTFWKGEVCGWPRASLLPPISLEPLGQIRGSRSKLVPVPRNTIQLPKEDRLQSLRSALTGDHT